MIFSSNENLLIGALNYEDYVSAKELSEHLFVSTKTIYRLVRRINDLSKADYNQSLVVSETGKGYKLNRFFIDKTIYRSINYTEENELLDSLLSLLYKHPKKISRKSFNLQYASESTLDRQMKKIQGKLKGFKIEIFFNQDFVWIEGSEVAIRKALNQLLSDMNTINTLGEIGIELNDMDKHFIDGELALVEESIGEQINYPYDINLYTHIYMLIKRYREGEVQYLEKQTPLEKEELQIMKVNQNIKKTAEKVVSDIEKYLNTKLNELETYFVFQNIYSINLRKRESSNLDKRLAEEISSELITNYFDLSDRTLLPSSRLLYEDLYQHILPMLSRLRNGMTLENGLLEEVKVEYRETYLKVKRIVEKINQELVFDTKINDAEIGYLSLYFEKYKISKNESKNLLLVCSTGVGTSELLKIRIAQNFPHLNVVATMSQRQMKNNQKFIQDNVDVVFSTLRLPVEIDKVPVLTISPLLSDQDIQKINYSLKELELWKQ